MFKRSFLTRSIIAVLLLGLCAPLIASEVLRFEVYLDDNGKRYQVKGSILDDGFRVRHQGGVEQADGCLMSFAYWDPNFLEEKHLLNSQTGELEGITVSEKGRGNVDVGGRTVSATRYALTTDKMTIDLWYNDALGWVGLASDTGKGRRLIYRRL